MGTRVRQVSEGAQTARRGIQVLRVIAEAREPLGLAEITRRVGLNKPAVIRLLQALMAEDMVARDAGGKRYAVGAGLIAMAAQVMQGVELRTLARPLMEQLGEQFGETVSLFVLHGHERICVDAVESRHPVRWVVPVGDTRPLSSGLTGRVLLAYVAPEEVDAIVAEAEGDVVGLDGLAAELATIRDAGWSFDPGEHQRAVNSVSSAIFDGTGVMAAMTISGPADRFTPKAAKGAGPTLRKATEELSVALGGGGKG
jgi:DNA-binding IclR family transcriptional regulator